MERAVSWSRAHWPAELASKVKALEDQLSNYESVLLAFSGGVDSSFLAAAAHGVLGDRALAVTSDTPLLARHDLAAARETAALIGIRHRILPGPEWDTPEVRKNGPDRCYHCKRALFLRLLAVAREEGLRVVIEGTNADDRNDYRPGRAACEELGVRSPLLEGGWTKQEIRAASRALGLPTADRPASPCLATRFPCGAPITLEGLRRVERGEAALRGLGFSLVRVRAFGDRAVVELAPEETARALNGPLGKAISQHLINAGFVDVTIDSLGYRMGKMNFVVF